MIVVAVKWTDGVSDSDAAALETGLRLDSALSSGGVTAVSAGPPDADAALRRALAAGASGALRVDVPAGLRSDAVARAIAPHCSGAAWVVCGDASADRGSGSVPALLAAELGVGQALGLVGVEPRNDGSLRLLRRLDGGRREVLATASPTVLSVEGSVARLRRWSLPAELAAQRAAIDVVGGPVGPVERPTSTRAYRPRPREMPMPAGDPFARISQLTDAGASPSRAEFAVLEPPAAARKILDALRAWGYLGRA